MTGRLVVVGAATAALGRATGAGAPPEEMTVPTDGPDDDVDLLDDRVATLTELDVEGGAGADGAVVERLRDVPA